MPIMHSSQQMSFMLSSVYIIPRKSRRERLFVRHIHTQDGKKKRERKRMKIIQIVLSTIIYGGTEEKNEKKESEEGEE